MKKLYRFEWDCGRNGTVEGTFVAEDTLVNSSIGEEVYFGEILGKHSEVYGTLSAEDLTVLTDDQDFIEKFQKFVPDDIGYNPLEYLKKNW